MGFCFVFFLCACRSETGLDEACSLLTLKYGSILDDETLEVSTDNLQARLHVAACSYLIALLHLLGTAGRAFGLANLQICAWQENQQRQDRSPDDEQDLSLYTHTHMHRKKIIHIICMLITAATADSQS